MRAEYIAVAGCVADVADELSSCLLSELVLDNRKDYELEFAVKRDLQTRRSRATPTAVSDALWRNTNGAMDREESSWSHEWQVYVSVVMGKWRLWADTWQKAR